MTTTVLRAKTSSTFSNFGIRQDPTAPFACERSLAVLNLIGPRSCDEGHSAWLGSRQDLLTI